MFPLLAALKAGAMPTSPTPRVHLHRDCNRPAGVELRCAAGHHIYGVGDILVQPGPAAHPIRRRV
jgi:hypothetical protein